MDRFKQGLASAAAAVPKNKESALAARDDFAAVLDQYDSLAKIEEKTGRTRVELVGAALAGFLGLMLLSIFVRPLGILTTRVFGFAYPAYRSFKAVEGTDEPERVQWLAYWFIYAIFALAEETILLPLEDALPLWFVFKIVFLVWCFLPQTQGAELLYTEVLRKPLLDLQEKLVKVKEE